MGERKDDPDQEEGSQCLQSNARIGESDRSQDEINGPEENGVAMTIKKAEEAKKSKRSKILQQNLKLIGTSMQSLVNLISFLPWRWQ